MSSIKWGLKKSGWPIKVNIMCSLYYHCLVCIRPAISPTLTAPSSLIHSTIHKAARTTSRPSLDLDPSWSWYLTCSHTHTCSLEIVWILTNMRLFSCEKIRCYVEDVSAALWSYDDLTRPGLGTGGQQPAASSHQSRLTASSVWSNSSVNQLNACDQNCVLLGILTLGFAPGLQMESQFV